MVLKDHINLPGLAGQHPLKGPNDHRFGGRFFALNDCYDKNFRKYSKEIAQELGLSHKVHEGVYAMLGGPNFGIESFVQMFYTSSVSLEMSQAIASVHPICLLAACTKYTKSSN